MVLAFAAPNIGLTVEVQEETRSQPPLLSHRFLQYENCFSQPSGCKDRTRMLGARNFACASGRAAARNLVILPAFFVTFAC